MDPVCFQVHMVTKCEESEIETMGGEEDSHVVVESTTSHVIEPSSVGNVQIMRPCESLESRLCQECVVFDPLVDPLVAVGPKGPDSTVVAETPSPVGSKEVASDGENAAFSGSTSVRSYPSSSDGFCVLEEGWISTGDDVDETMSRKEGGI